MTAVVRNGLEPAHRWSCVASPPSAAFVWWSLLPTNLQGFVTGLVEEAFERRIFLQLAHRCSCVTGLPAGAIVRGRVQPAHHRDFGASPPPKWRN